MGVQSSNVGMNGEMEDNFSFNQFTFTLCDIISKWSEKVFLQNIPTALFQNWNKHFTNGSNLSITLNYTCN